MRDFERLEELSTTVQSGLRSNEVIWAIDQALAGHELDAGALASLRCGRDILHSWRETGAMADPGGARRSQSMLGSEARSEARVVVLASQLDGEDSDEEATKILEDLAKSLEAVSTGAAAADYQESLELAAEVFSSISEIKLGQANGIVRARKERASWLQQTTISTSS